MIKIYLAPSNQNANMYYGGKTNEAEQCRKVSNAIEKLLAQYDCEVKAGKDSENLSTKCENAKAWGADSYVSIHSNAFNGSARGTECLYANNDSRAAKSKELASCINAEMAKIFPTNRGVKVANDLIDCYMPDMPSTICEMGFHDNKDDAAIILNNIDKLAQAFCNALVAYHGLKKKDSKEEKEEAKGYYRVGTAWENGKCVNQKGAFKVKQNAINLCNTYEGHYVFDNDGKVIHKSTKSSTGDIVYIVKKDDTLSEIAEKYGVASYEELAEYNGIKNPNLIYEGQKIRIPNTANPTYTVMTVISETGLFYHNDYPTSRKTRAGAFVWGAKVKVMNGWEVKNGGYTWCKVLHDNKIYYCAKDYLK